jgi:Fe-S-cluster containining protein
VSKSPSTISARCQQECQARCCRYITVQLPAPKNVRDLDEIAWWLAHHDVSVYVESRRWHLEVRVRCKYLNDDNLCVIYEHRPRVCRDYDTAACEYPGRPEHALQFDSMDDFNYWREKKRRTRAARRSAHKSTGSSEGARGKA